MPLQRLSIAVTTCMAKADLETVELNLWLHALSFFTRCILSDLPVKIKGFSAQTLLCVKVPLCKSSCVATLLCCNAPSAMKFLVCRSFFEQKLLFSAPLSQSFSAEKLLCTKDSVCKIFCRQNFCVWKSSPVKNFLCKSSVCKSFFPASSMSTLRGSYRPLLPANSRIG